MKKLVTFILGSFIILSLSSCSLAKLGYSYGDWLIKRKIVEVIKLYSPQQDRLEGILDDFMAWHKKNMLKRYQDEMDRVTSLVSTSFKDPSRPIKPSDIENFLLTTRSLYWDSFNPLVQKVSPILAELGEEQVDRSRTLLNRKLDEKKDLIKLEQSDKAAYIKEMKKTWSDNLEEWFGPLEESQTKVLNNSFPRLMTSPKARFARGVERMKNFMAIFEDNPLSKEGKDSVIKNRTVLIRVFFKQWSEDDYYRQWRNNVSRFMAEFFSTLSKKQKSQFLEKLRSWNSTLSEIARD